MRGGAVVLIVHLCSGLVTQCIFGVCRYTAIIAGIDIIHAVVNTYTASYPKDPFVFHVSGQYHIGAVEYLAGFGSNGDALFELVAIYHKTVVFQAKNKLVIRLLQYLPSVICAADVDLVFRIIIDHHDQSSCAAGMTYFVAVQTLAVVDMIWQTQHMFAIIETVHDQFRRSFQP